MPPVADPVLFPDVTAAVCALLHDTTGEATDYRPTPGHDGGKLLVARRTGGVAADVVIDRATVVVEAWADTYEDAQDLAQTARAHLLAIHNEQVGDALLYRAVELGAPGWDPDPLSGSPRFTGTYTVEVRGSAI